MNKEQKVISQSLAKKIHDKAIENGFELPDSEWMHSEFMGHIISREWFLLQEPFNEEKLQDDSFRQAVENTYPAYDIAELGEMLPDTINYRDKETYSWIEISKTGNKWSIVYRVGCAKADIKIKEENLAEAMGKMFLYLLDNDLL